MGPGVVADDVSLVGHPGQQILVGERHLAAHEEHRPYVVLGQRVQDVRGVAGVGSVVEGQHHGPAASGNLQQRLVAHQRLPAGGVRRAVSGQGLETVGRGLDRAVGRWAGGGERRPDRLVAGDRREHSGRAGRPDRGGAGQQGPTPGEHRRRRRRQPCEQLILRHDSSVARRSSDAPQQHRCGGTNTPTRSSADVPERHDETSGRCRTRAIGFGPGLVPSVEAGCRGRWRAGGRPAHNPPFGCPLSAKLAHRCRRAPYAARTCGFR